MDNKRNFSDILEESYNSFKDNFVEDGGESVILMCKGETHSSGAVVGKGEDVVNMLGNILSSDTRLVEMLLMGLREAMKNVLFEKAMGITSNDKEPMDDKHVKMMGDAIRFAMATLNEKRTNKS